MSTQPNPLRGVDLTTWERLLCVLIVGASSGPVAEIRAAGKVLDVLDFTDEEKAAAGIVVDASGVTSWADDSKTWACLGALDKAGLTVLKRAVSNYSGWTARDAKKVEALLAKLGLD